MFNMKIVSLSSIRYIKVKLFRNLNQKKFLSGPGSPQTILKKAPFDVQVSVFFLTGRTFHVLPHWNTYDLSVTNEIQKKFSLVFFFRVERLSKPHNHN